MSRKPQTCADCARRKIKCDKIIPCSNCTKRGSAHLCRRAEVTHTVERRPSGLAHSVSPRASYSSPTAPRRGDAEAPINERILSLVTTLSERVKHLESKIDDFEPRKRSSVDEPVEYQDFPTRPIKQARMSQSEPVQTIQHIQHDDVIQGENESSSAQNSSDAEAEDAATVLEFLAWGRLKDSNLTTGVRDPTSNHDSAAYPDKDVIQTTQAWGQSPTSMSTGQTAMETLQISQIQEMLPSKAQVMLLFDYHSDWLLFMHCSFHVQTFRKELDMFYQQDNGIINMTTVGLQWTSLLFAILCGSMTCAKPAQVMKWGFLPDDQKQRAEQWYQASIECLTTAKYQQNHNLYSIQTIASSTICAHMLGFSNSQSVMLASAVRIAHSLGLHRLARPKKSGSELECDNFADTVQKELGRRLWEELATQDWFSVPFSETYCVNPLHFTTKPPLHCDEDTMLQMPLSKPTITSYGRFLYRIAYLMPVLQDRISQAPTLSTKYKEVLHFDKLMRELVISQLPPPLNSQTTVDPTWQSWVALARRCLTITSAHKIIMIHRKFLGMSFHDKRFSFTRKTCLAAAKTIINEVKEVPEESPILWTMQAFSVAAAIILSLDNFNRHQSAREYAEHRQLVTQAIEFLSNSVSVSSIASRGTRLLTELLAEEHNVHARNPDTGNSASSQNEVHRSFDPSEGSKSSEKSLNVAAFVKKFCESDLPPSGSSPIATSHVPLWLQQDGSSQNHFGHQRISEEQYSASNANVMYPEFSSNPTQQSYDMPESGYQIPSTIRRHDTFANAFGQNFGEPFDIRSVNWFDDLLGLAPSHSI